MWLTCRRPGFNFPAPPNVSCQQHLIFAPLFTGGSPTIFEKCSRLNIFSSRKPEVMLPIIFLVFPVISLLEKNRLLLNVEKRSCVPPPSPSPSNVQKTFPVAKLICESSLYNNIGNLFVSKFCPCTVHWRSRVANFTRDGQAIISENYIIIVGEKLLLWP